MYTFRLKVPIGNSILRDVYIPNISSRAFYRLFKLPWNIYLEKSKEIFGISLFSFKNVRIKGEILRTPLRYRQY